MSIRRVSPVTSLGLGLLGLTLLAPAARAQIRWIETGEFAPTATVVAVPRTYLVPATTTIAMPTSAYVPTTATANVYLDAPVSYVPSSYLTATSVEYLPARPAYRAFRPRRYYERSYLATPRTLVPTYYVTTGMTSGLVATSAGLCCETPCCADASASATPAQAPAPATKVVPRETRTSGEFDERQPKAIDSSVAGDPNYRSFDAGKPARDEGLNAAGSGVDPVTPAPRTAMPGAGLTRDGRSSAVDPLATDPKTAATDAAKTAVPADPKAAPADPRAVPADPKAAPAPLSARPPPPFARDDQAGPVEADHAPASCPRSGHAGPRCRRAHPTPRRPGPAQAQG